jgi:hypothetical protein
MMRGNCVAVPELPKEWLEFKWIGRDLSKSHIILHLL